jgi:hypothetical protein
MLDSFRSDAARPRRRTMSHQHRVHCTNRIVESLIEHSQTRPSSTPPTTTPPPQKTSLFPLCGLFVFLFFFLFFSLFCSDFHCACCSSNVDNMAHAPSASSFHSVTLLSPPLTAKIPPVSDQLTRHTTSVNLGSTRGCHVSPSARCVHTTTTPSCAQLASVRSLPTRGAQATSRTQSECSARSCSRCHWFVAVSNFQILIKLSQPPDAMRCTASAPAPKS